MRDEWYVARRGEDGSKRYGPVPLLQLRDLVDTGKVRGEDLVWCEGMGTWERADRCQALAPPAPPPRRDPPPDRRGYSNEPGRRGYVPRDDDRPFPRPAPPRPSSSGWVIGLVVGGVAVVLCFLVCGGVVAYSYMSARPPMTAAKSAVSTYPKTAVKPDDAFIKPFEVPPPAGLGHVIPYGLSQLYYTDNVTDLQAQDLGAYLNEQGVFPIDHGVTVQLDFQGGDFVVRFCVNPGAAFDNGVVNYYRNLRNMIENNSGAFFQGAVVDVDLCDAQMITQRTLRIGD